MWFHPSYSLAGVLLCPWTCCISFWWKFNIQKTKIMAISPITSWQIDGETMEIVTADGEIKRCLLFWRKVMTYQDSILKSRDITNKGPYSQNYGFSSSRVWMWQLDHKESWALKNWCFLTMVLEKTLDCPLDCKKIQPVNPRRNQS